MAPVPSAICCLRQSYLLWRASRRAAGSSLTFPRCLFCPWPARPRGGRGFPRRAAGAAPSMPEHFFGGGGCGEPLGTTPERPFGVAKGHLGTRCRCCCCCCCDPARKKPVVCLKKTLWNKRGSGFHVWALEVQFQAQVGLCGLRWGVKLTAATRSRASSLFLSFSALRATQRDFLAQEKTEAAEDQVDLRSAFLNPPSSPPNFSLLGASPLRSASGSSAS